METTLPKDWQEIWRVRRTESSRRLSRAGTKLVAISTRTSEGSIFWFRMAIMHEDAAVRSALAVLPATHTRFGVKTSAEIKKVL